MAISPKAQVEFLERDFRDSQKWKETPAKQLKDWVIEGLQFRPRFKYQPYHHQWVCLALGWKYSRYYFALDMGLGKSKVVIDLFRFRRRFKQATRMLVVVPSVTNLAAWREQLEEHGAMLSFTLLDGKGREAREEQWRADSQVLVATYAGVRAMLCERVAGKGMQPIPRAVTECKRLFNFYVLDEASAVGSQKSINFRLFRQIAKSPHAMYLLSGTLFSKDPQALWPQMYLLDGGWLLGKTMGMFRACMFREEANPWATKYVLRASMREPLHRMLRHSTVRYTEDEALDLPDRVGGIAHPMVIGVEFTASQWKVYDAIQLDASEAWEQDGALTPEAYLEKRYALAGYRRAGESGLIRIGGRNPKLDALVELVAELREQFGPQEKIIVTHHYQETGRYIAATLAEQKVPYCEVRGGKSVKGLAAWKHDPDIPVLVASRSAAFGLNLQCARIMIFFESPDSIEYRDQLERRIYRAGQSKVCYYYDLVIRNSLDEKILHALRTNRSVREVILEGGTARRLAAL